MTICDAEHLHKYDKEEWRDVVRTLRLDWSEEDMDQKWSEFVEWKRRREMY